jgi:hypothetical protein
VTAQPVTQDTDSPMLWGNGPAECSSCTDLSVVPGVIWDVNGYYRSLGADPRADRKALRLAYQAKDGQASARLTYVMGQLLNPEIRRAYDLMPLGSIFMDDYVREEINRFAKARAAERAADLSAKGWDVTDEMYDDLLDETFRFMGVTDEPEDTPSEPLDQGIEMSKDPSSPAKFAYAYYIWRTSIRRALDREQDLAAWQGLLISALAQEGIRTRFSIGWHGSKDHDVLLAQVGYRQVFFLGLEVTPTEELALKVARRVRLGTESITGPSPSQRHTQRETP